MNATVAMKEEVRKDSLVRDIPLDKIHKSSTSLPLFAVWDNNSCFGNSGAARSSTSGCQLAVIGTAHRARASLRTNRLVIAWL